MKLMIETLTKLLKLLQLIPVKVKETTYSSLKKKLSYGNNFDLIFFILLKLNVNQIFIINSKMKKYTKTSVKKS